MADLTHSDITEAFAAIREHSAVLVHPLIDCIERLLLAERDERQARARQAALLDLNDILAEHDEPATCMEEVERAGILLTVPSVVRDGQVLRDRIARGAP